MNRLVGTTYIQLPNDFELQLRTSTAMATHETARKRTFENSKVFSSITYMKSR